MTIDEIFLDDGNVFACPQYSLYAEYGKVNYINVNTAHIAIDNKTL